MKKINANTSNYIGYIDLKNQNQIKNYFYYESDHQISFDEVSGTMMLGSGWKHIAGSTTGKDFYKTNSYIYTDEEGREIILETTLDVTNIPITPVVDPVRTVQSGHNTNIPGQLIYDFGADAGNGKKFSVIINEEEITLKAGEANEIKGQFGTLTLDENGLLSYKANSNAEGKDVFEFRIQDSDGNVVSADADGNPVRVTVNVEKPELEISDEGIMEGSRSINLNLTGYELVDVRMDSDVASISHSGNNWNYILDGAIDHETYGDTPGGNHTDTLYLTYEDKFGNTYDVEKKITIHDDAPKLWNMDINLINQFETTQSSNGSLDWFYDFGADTWGDKASIAFLAADGQVNIKEGTEQKIRGEFGWMTLTFSDGHVDFHYEADEDAEVRDTFNFQFTDSDGDTRTNSIEIRTRFGIDINEGDMGTTGSNNLVKLPAWLSNCRIIDIEIQNTAGYAYQDATGEWYYYLANPLDHIAGAPGVLGEYNDVIQDEIILWYRDQDGKLSNVVNSVFIHDSNPELVDYTVNAENMTTIIGGTDAKDNPYFYDFGADDNPEKAKLYVTGADGTEQEVTVYEIEGEYGRLSINASGGHMAYRYEMHEDKKGTNCSDVFNFRIVDSDGDEKTSTFTVNTTFDENYDPNLVYDPANIQPIADDIIPDDGALDSSGEETSADDADGNQETKKQNGALPSDVALETEVISIIPDNQDVIDVDNRDKAQTENGESPEQNEDDSSNEPDKPIMADSPESETPDNGASAKSSGGDDMEASGGRPEEDHEEDVQEPVNQDEAKDFPEESGLHDDNSPCDGNVSGSIGDELDELFAENGFKVAKVESKAPEIEDLPDVRLVDGNGNIDIDALMASVCEDVDKNEDMDKDESLSSLSVIEPAEADNVADFGSNDRDDDFASCSIEIPNDAPVYDAGSEAEVASKVMAEAGFA